MGDNIQFYTTNRFEGAAASATSNNDYANVVLDNDNRSYWASSGSSDGDNQGMSLELVDAVDIDHILLLGNNFKTGIVEYYDGSWHTAVTISSTLTDRLIDLGSVKTGATSIRFNVTETETADNEKRCAMFVGCLLRFELQVNPGKVVPEIKNSIDINTNSRGLINLSRNGNDIFALQLDFKNLGSPDSEDDFNNLIEIQRTRESFLINLTGDTERGDIPYTWNWIKKMAIISNGKIPLSAGIHGCGINLSMNLAEVK